MEELAKSPPDGSIWFNGNEFPIVTGLFSLYSPRFRFYRRGNPSSRFEIPIDVSLDDVKVFVDACQYRDYSLTDVNPYGVLALAAWAEADSIVKEVTCYIDGQGDKACLGELHARLTFGPILWPTEDSGDPISELQSKIQQDPLKYANDPLFYRLPVPIIGQILDLTHRDLNDYFGCILKVIDSYGQAGSRICAGVAIGSLAVDKLIALFRKNEFDWSVCAGQLPVALANVRKAKEDEIARLKQ
jgi:hypothetical protein